MAYPPENLSLDAFQGLLGDVNRLREQDRELVETLLTIVNEQLAPPAAFASGAPFEGIGASFARIYPVVMADPRALPLMARAAAALPPAPIAHTSPTEKPFAAAIGLGLAAGLVVAGAIVIHELWTADL